MSSHVLGLCTALFSYAVLSKYLINSVTLITISMAGPEILICGIGKHLALSGGSWRREVLSLLAEALGYFSCCTSDISSHLPCNARATTANWSRQLPYFSRTNSKSKIPGKDHTSRAFVMSTLGQYHKHARVLPHCWNLVHMGVSKGAKNEPPAWLLHE